MRFHHLALSAVFSLMTIGSFSGNNGGFALAEETTTPETPETPENITIPDDSESFAFEAEVSRMLDIVINSLYQNKDVFLRELISNASDALDKVRFLSIEQPDILKDKEDLEVRIQYDEEEHTVTISDSGIGMTHDDLVSNLGTVARSGTTKFLEALKEGADIGTIGMFGVGFYSSFLVADRVKVASKHPDDPVQHVWESVNGDSTFHIYEDPRGNSLGRGTEITLYLKEDAFDYAKSDKLKDIASYYSEFISHPIHLQTITVEMEPVEPEETEEDDDDEDEESDEVKDSEDEDEEKKDDLEMGEDEDEDEDEEEEKEPEMREVVKKSWDQVNTNKPIWTREKDDITDDEYKAFYKAINKSEWEDPAYWSHFSAEGNINFKSLVYLPSETPAELQNGNFDMLKKGMVKLYVRKVLISDEFELLPQYLSWVKGVVDSDDLPLNVNRETLQESKVIKIIGKKMVRKILEMIKKLATESDNKQKEAIEKYEEKEAKKKSEEVELDADGNIVTSEDDDEEDDAEGEDTPEAAKRKNEYLKFYRNFHPSIKLGIIKDEPNRNRLAKLLRYDTSKTDGAYDLSSLEGYVSRMKEWQDKIYYISGMDLDQLKDSHFMKKFYKKDVEVIFMKDPIDEYMMYHLKDFDGKEFQAITKEGLKLGDEDEDLEKRREKVYKEKFKPLSDYLEKKLKFSSVAISSRLEDVPALVTTTEYGQSATMERINSAQIYASKDINYSPSQKILEINPRHPVITKLLENVTPPADYDEGDGDDKKAYDPGQKTLDLVKILVDVAMVNSGFPLKDVQGHTKRFTRILKDSLDVESLEVAEEINPPPEEDEDDSDDEDEDSEIPQYEMGGEDDVTEFDI